jgi:hypothetical protein
MFAEAIDLVDFQSHSPAVFSSVEIKAIAMANIDYQQSFGMKKS